MPRRPRLHFPGALYHVILRGNARQDIFFEDEDRYRFCFLVQEGVERFRHRVVAFCLMTNHVHLAVQVTDVPLSRIVQNVSFRYTRWINRRRNRSGHLFQGRYKAFVVDADPYLLELVAYIHLNPVRAGMVENADDFRWSSHRAYLGMETVPWLYMELVLGQFSKERAKARRELKRFVDARSSEGHRDEFHGETSTDSRFIGDDEFVDGILRQEDTRLPRKPSLGTILAVAGRLYDLTENELSAPGQKRRSSEARMLAAWAVREMSDATLAELAKRMGRDASAMSAAAMRFDRRMKQDVELSEKVEMFRKEISFFQA